ncbi:MAG: hypothetical protein HYS23_09600 [Geobacter sp.]|nr:hypothetical protein [Geobacter sp.]
MFRLIRNAGLILISLQVFTGCATYIGVPQTRDEFVTMCKPGGLFRSAEHVTVKRPVKAVVADVKEYAKKCLDVTVTNPPNYMLKETGGTTTYRPKIEATRDGTTALSLQEDYHVKFKSGEPPGGLFTLVAELSTAGKNSTQVDIYHTSRDKVADSLKQWIDGDKGSCPSFKRGW